MVRKRRRVTKKGRQTFKAHKSRKTRTLKWLNFVDVQILRLFVDQHSLSPARIILDISFTT